jgi:RNA polymerase sporulation-specific sigma factor
VSPSVRALSDIIDLIVSQDLLQEGMLAALAAIGRYDPERGKARTFFIQCAKNRMLNEVKRLRMIGGEGEEELDKLADPGEPDRGRYDMLYSAIDKCLTEREKETVTLYLAGLSYREIAARLGISEKSVDNAMQRARRKLREELDKCN